MCTLLCIHAQAQVYTETRAHISIHTILPIKGFCFSACSIKTYKSEYVYTNMTHENKRWTVQTQIVSLEKRKIQPKKFSFLLFAVSACVRPCVCRERKNCHIHICIQTRQFSLYTHHHFKYFQNWKLKIGVVVVVVGVCAAAAVVVISLLSVVVDKRVCTEWTMWIEKVTAAAAAPLKSAGMRKICV